MRVSWIRTGDHGWLMRLPDGAVVVRRLDGAAQPVERLLDQRLGDAHGLTLAVFGLLDPVFFEPLDRTVAGGVDLGERYVAVFAEQLEDPKLHLGLKQIDCAADIEVLDLRHVVHRFVSFATRLAARARVALPPSIEAELLACSA